MEKTQQKKDLLLALYQKTKLVQTDLFALIIQQLLFQ